MMMMMMMMIMNIVSIILIVIVITIVLPVMMYFLMLTSHRDAEFAVSGGSTLFLGAMLVLVACPTDAWYR